MKLPVLFGPMRGVKWVVGSSVRSCWLGTYERQTQELLAACTKTGQVAVDCGANVGFFTIMLSRLLGESGRVIAFEPLPANARQLREHLELNDIRNVSFYEAATGAETGRQKFALGDSTTQGRLTDEGDLEVEVHALDDLVTSGRIPPPDVVKIDVEGAERDVLEGARRTLAAQRPSLIIATHGWRAHEACLELLRELREDPVWHQRDSVSGNGMIFIARDEVVFREWSGSQGLQGKGVK